MHKFRSISARWKRPREDFQSQPTSEGQVVPRPQCNIEIGLNAPSSQNPTSASAFPDGVEVLHECPSAAFDICFIHGLTGDRRTTWTANQESTPWPQTLLPLQVSQARVLTYGYDAYIVRKPVASSNRLIDHAANLLTDLTADRASCNASSRPLIFIAHSLGGLICKKAILLSRNNPEPHLRGIFNYTKEYRLQPSPNTSLLDVLQTENQLLESLQIDFWAMVRELREAGRRLEVTSFFEELRAQNNNNGAGTQFNGPIRDLVLPPAQLRK